ncbi:hypothetical protein MNBD_NITROSPINAE01-1120 [hydrothermal vent metagenome]|uniref:PABS domain-containing protein n=1 Tax=hydrothermal vent metagenome TaxID=652676 RepID=A0A3B1C0C3_9ZZZZ
MTHILLLGFFFISGAVGVAYEVVFVRELSLLLGVTIYAVSAVLVAFMGGLGVGAFWFGKTLDKGFAPIRLYAILEIALGLYILSFPVVLSIAKEIYIAVHPGTEGVNLFVIGLRFALAVIVLALPTILMGGTLPALARHFSKSGGDVGKFTGGLYGINTLGAMAGCLIAGFFMIENFGLTATLRVGALLNIAIGVAVWLLAAEKGWRDVPAGEAPKKKKKASKTVKPDSSILFLFGISGFCALSLQLLWTRSLILLLNNTTYAFSLILTIFLFGIGAGSLVTSRFTHTSIKEGRVYFARFQLGVAFFALLSLVGFGLSAGFLEFITLFAPEGGLLASIIPGGSPMATAFIFSLLAVFPSAFFMGGGFPLIVEAYSSGTQKVGGEVGRLYSANIVGCVLGSVVAGYFLIPLIGLQKSILLVAWISCLAGIYLLFVSAKGWMKETAVALALIIPLTGFTTYNSDIAFYLSAQKLDLGSEVLYYEEGPSATVLVSTQESDLSAGRAPLKRLWINGDPIAGAFREALQLERLQAHIPLLLHPNPKDALVICFGTGSTAGAVTTHDLRSVTAVDISPEVFKAGASFTKANRDVINNKTVRLVEEDGRNFLLTTKRKFDFITSEPPPPSNAGVVSLYTVDYYRLIKQKLNPGGIVSQWIPLHHVSEDDFRMLVASFMEVFPKGSIWYTKWDAIMIGAENEIPIDVKRLSEKMKAPKVAKSLEEIGIKNGLNLLANYMMGPENAKKFVGTTAGLSDDWPIVEFTSARINTHTTGLTIKGANLEALLEYRELPEKAVYENLSEEEEFKRYFKSQGLFLRGQVERNYGKNGFAASYYAKALAANEDNQDALFSYLSLNISTLYSVLSSGSRADLGLKMQEATVKLDKDGLFAPQLHFLRGMFYAMKGENENAEKELTSAVKLDENYFMAIVNLAGLNGYKLGNVVKAKELYTRALGLNSSEEEKVAIARAMLNLK